MACRTASGEMPTSRAMSRTRVSLSWLSALSPSSLRAIGPSCAAPAPTAMQRIAVKARFASDTRSDQSGWEQPGCLHANMDLYKYAFWFSPLVPSDLIADCFENAARARELDMRASPYDMTPFGHEPIRVETPAGRREYAVEQLALMDVSVPLRHRLLCALLDLQAAAAPATVSSASQEDAGS